jgi:hypothetical protein
MPLALSAAVTARRHAWSAGLGSTVWALLTPQMTSTIPIARENRRMGGMIGTKP